VRGRASESTIPRLRGFRILSFVHVLCMFCVCFVYVLYHGSQVSGFWVTSLGVRGDVILLGLGFGV